MDNGLIKVEVNENQEPVVSGRQLHEGLGIGTQYTKWFERMISYGFIENIDFLTISQKRLTAQGNETTYIDHILKLDMAKEIAMIQRSDKGKQIRQYFIQVEKEWNSPEKVMARALIMANKQLSLANVKIEELEGEIEKNKPKIDWYERFLNSEGTYTATQVGKLIGYPSAQKLNTELSKLKIQYKQGKYWIPNRNTDKEWYKLTINEFGTQLKWKPKGIVEISKILGNEISEEKIKEVMEEEYNENRL